MQISRNLLPIALLFCFINCSIFKNCNAESTDLKNLEESYRRLFKLRRVDQKNAVSNIRKIDNYEKQYNMVKIVTNQLFNTLRNSRGVVESSGYIPGLSKFPSNKTTLEGLSSILENTALFGEIILHLPDITQHLLFFNNHWKVLYEWCLAFSTESKGLLDNNTLKLYSLVIQELYPDKREENYVNPYWKQEIKKKIDIENRTDKPKTRKRLKKGPRLYNEL